MGIFVLAGRIKLKYALQKCNITTSAMNARNNFIPFMNGKVKKEFLKHSALKENELKILSVFENFSFV